MLKNNHILVTGANGFVGRHLCSALYEMGANVTQIVRSTAQSDQIENHKIVLDLTEQKMVMDAFADLQPNYVIHLAGSKNRNSSTTTEFFDSYNANLLLSVNVIKACLELNNLKRLVFLGSCDEYGPTSNPFDETQREMPVNSYGLAKLTITKMLSGLYQSSQLPSIILRPTVIYGPNQGNEMFLSALIQSLLKNDDFAMTYGDQLRDFVYIDDVVSAIIKALNAGDQANGVTVNIGAGISHKVKYIAKLAANLIHPDANNHLKFGAIKYRQNETMNYGANINRALKLLDWQPTTQIKDGLQKTISYFEKTL